MQVQNPATKKGLFKGKWSIDSSVTTDGTNAITLTTFAKGQCRGNSTTGVRNDSGSSACEPINNPINVGTGAYKKTYLSKTADANFDTGVGFILYKDKDSCSNYLSRPYYHFAEQAIAGTNECLRPAWFAGGKDISVTSCSYPNMYYNVYSSNDGTCTELVSSSSTVSGDLCADQTSLSGHMYGFVNFICV